ncbi:hypothetical protein EVAR_42574_1 [Eumeta japonica]|uniref:Uncharacterized protein n=1 Tax=Eumeta variegata TaxID=151549 RepID=A0A4C1WSA9_EUMVA|nr:hypothetical protein EVAR_42574_1 [Eumeta japonica]
MFLIFILPLIFSSVIAVQGRLSRTLPRTKTVYDTRSLAHYTVILLVDSDEAIDVGGAHRLPLERRSLGDIGRVGDGKHRAPLGSDGRLFRIGRVADAPGVRSSPEGAGLKIQRREVGTLDPSRRGDERSISTTESLHSVSEVLFRSRVIVAFNQRRRILVLYVEVPGDSQIFRWAEFIKRGLDAFVVVVVGFVVGIGVGHKMARAAGGERRPQHARIERRSAVYGTGTARLARAALATASGSVWK